MIFIIYLFFVYNFEYECRHEVSLLVTYHTRPTISSTTNMNDGRNERTHKDRHVE